MVAEFWDCLRLDPAPVSDLKRLYAQHLETQGRADLIVNLLGVDFAGSSTLGGLVSIQRLGRQHDGRVVVCNVAPQVREVFRVTRLETLFTFAENLAEAQSKLAERKRGGPASVEESTDANSTPEPSRTPSSGPLRLRRKPR